MIEIEIGGDRVRARDIEIEIEIEFLFRLFLGDMLKGQPSQRNPSALVPPRSLEFENLS